MPKGCGWEISTNEKEIQAEAKRSAEEEKNAAKYSKGNAPSPVDIDHFRSGKAGKEDLFFRTVSRAKRRCGGCGTSRY